MGAAKEGEGGTGDSGCLKVDARGIGVPDVLAETDFDSGSKWDSVRTFAQLSGE